MLNDLADHVGGEAGHIPMLLRSEPLTGSGASHNRSKDYDLKKMACV